MVSVDRTSPYSSPHETPRLSSLALGLGAGLGGGFGGGQVQTTPIQLVKPDYDAFEQILVHVQDAYGREDQVAQELASISAAGMRGIAVSFVNYLNEVPYFCDEVLPRLARLGVRQEN